MSPLTRSFLLMLLAVVLYSLMCPPADIGILAWVALIPFLASIRHATRRQSLYLGFLYGMISAAIISRWLVFVTIPGWVGVSIYVGVYIACFGIGARLIWNKYEASALSWMPLILIPALWVALEYARATLLGGFGWTLLGYSQYRVPPLIQISDITGSYGVSFVLCMANVALFEAIHTQIKSSVAEQRIQLNRYLALPVVLIIAVFIYGVIRIATYQPADTLRVAVIQGNIPQRFKWNAARRQEIWDVHERLTLRAAKEDPGIIVWPETSVPGYLEDTTVMQRIQSLSREVKRPILVGTPSRKSRASENTTFFNSALLLTEEGGKKQYNKIKLVPFGEYLPLDSQIYLIRSLVPRESPYLTPGKKFTIFNISGMEFGVTICFEDIFPSLTRRFVRHGADFMVNMTNNALFGHSGAPRQHLQQSVFRAVENKVNFVRAANTGISCIIAPTGKIIARVQDDRGRDTFVKGYSVADIKVKKNPWTVYNVIGDVFSWTCIAGLIVFFFPKKRARRL